MDCLEWVMYLSLFKQMVAVYAESTGKTESEEKDTSLPDRCKICRDLPHCDRDYCLRWYH